MGVDVGGTKVAAALVDDAGEIVRRAGPRPSPPTTRHGRRDRRCGDRGERGRRRGGVGLAIAGNVAADGSHVLFSPHLPLAGEPLAADLRSALGVPSR